MDRRMAFSSFVKGAIARTGVTEIEDFALKPDVTVSLPGPSRPEKDRRNGCRRAE